MKKHSLLLLFMAVTMALSGCGTPKVNTEEPTVTTASTDPIVSDNPTVSTQEKEVDYFSDRDYEVGYNQEESAIIQLNGDSAYCASNAVRIDGTTVTILDEGTYILTGTLNDGMVIVNSEKTDKTQLVLDNVTIHSETSAPIYILQSDKVFITMTPDSVNTLSCGEGFTPIDENNIDGAIYSKEDITLNGSGSLVITSPAGHGIVSKDSLAITSGTYTITSASHGLTGKDDVCIANAAFIITAGKDGLHGENADDAALGYVYIESGTFEITSEGDGISGSSYVQIQDGSFTITSGGGSVNGAKKTSDNWGGFMGGPPQGGGPGRGGMGDMSSTETKEDSTSIKGIKATTELVIESGTFQIDSADDAIHANGNVTVNGGIFEIATGDDAFHADETLTVNNGTVLVTESYEGLEGLHIQVSGGDITLTASDDGLNAAGGTDQSGFGGQRPNEGFGGRGGMGGMGGMGGASNGSIVISGGSLHITASGDGIDANGTLEISGGFTTVCGPTQGDTATLDYDSSAVITGGTFIGTGASGMAQTFSDSEQGVIAVRAGNQRANTQITLTDSDGKTLISYAPELPFSVVILSCPEMVKGQTYTLSVGTESRAFEAK